MNVFERWGLLVARTRWLVLSAAVAVAATGIVWGTGVFNDLVGGGFDDPDSEAVRAGEAIERDLGDQDVDVIALYRSKELLATDPRFRESVLETVEALRNDPAIESVTTYYDANSPSFLSHDQHQTFAAIRLAADGDDDKREAFVDIEDQLQADGLTTQVGGAIAFQQTTDEITERDLARAEMYAMPIVLLLLILIFRGAVAAALPILIGLVSVLGALTTTRLIAGATDVSTFAINTITLLGLGMAIDYSLLMVSRYREELAAGHTTATAVARTVASAGRTVLISGVTIVLALSSLLLFPHVFLRSMGMGGMAAVTLAMLGSLTVLPALLAVLGPRVNALRLRLPHAKRTRRITRERGRWGAFAAAIMRRPIITLVASFAVLGLLAAPFLGVKSGGVDERVMPEGAEPRVVAEELTEEFPGRTSAPIQVFLDGVTAADARGAAEQIQNVAGVTAADITAQSGDAALVSVSYEGARTGDHAYDAVEDIRDLDMRAGTTMLVGGQPALDVDRLDSLGERLPWVAAVMAGATLALLFLSFGSLLLPIKAVAMNVVSIAAAFGAVVWVFQDGNLSDALGFTPSGFIEPNIPILLLVILFGLSTDYEVFLLSRVKEAWDETGNASRAVELGVERTGGIITSAALLLIVVVAGFATGQITFAKMIGIGMATAIVVDATLVRMLLVPAVMRLMGRASWWLPGHLRVFHTRFGIHESGAIVPAPLERVRT